MTGKTGRTDELSTEQLFSFLSDNLTVVISIGEERLSTSDNIKLSILLKKQIKNWNQYVNLKF